MEITKIFIWVCFIFCLGLTAGGILVLFRDSKYKMYPSFRYLQYYLVLVYTFGFYSIWSKIFFQIFYGSKSTLAQNTIVSNFLIILGIPFLVTGKLMLVSWSISLLKKRPGTLLLTAVFTIIFLIVFIYITFVRFNILSNIRQIYAVFVISINLFMILAFWFSEIPCLTKKQKLICLLLMAFFGLIYAPLFFTALNQAVAELVFIFLFFLANTTLAVYFAYSVKFPLETENEYEISPVSIDSFITKYNITAREAEIVWHIYQGMTNKEIADKLFVTVQTIKDHTHRIYQKTDVKSRAQLTSLLRTFF